MNKGGYAVRKVKSFEGNEGKGFNAELLRDGKPVALVIDDANGGEYGYRWYDHAEARVEVLTTSYDGKPWTMSCTPEEAKLKVFVDALPKEENPYDHKMYPVGTDGFVGNMVDEYENDRKFQRMAKTKTLYRQVGDEAGVWHVLKAPYSKRVKDYVLAECAKAGKALEVVYNETIGQVAA